MPEIYCLTRTAYEQIVEQARQGFPVEICGFVAGMKAGNGQQIQPATNVSSHPRDAYDIAPEATLSALLKFESQGYKITGIYHSHPNYPARPSGIDLKLADMPNVCCLIIGVQARGQQLEFELKAYYIIDKKAYEVQLELIN